MNSYRSFAFLIFSLLSTALLVCPSALASGKTDEADSLAMLYEVKMTLTLDGEVVASPYLVVEKGREASVALEIDPAGELAFNILVDDPQNIALPLPRGVEVTGLVLDVAENTWVNLPRRQFKLGVTDGQESTMEFGQEFHLAVTTTRLGLGSPGDRDAACTGTSSSIDLEGGVVASSGCCVAVCPNGHALRCCGASICCEQLCGACCFQEP